MKTSVEQSFDQLELLPYQFAFAAEPSRFKTASGLANRTKDHTDYDDAGRGLVVLNIPAPPHEPITNKPQTPTSLLRPASQ